MDLRESSLIKKTNHDVLVWSKQGVCLNHFPALCLGLYHSSREAFTENIDDFFILFLANLFGIMRNLDLEIELTRTCDRVRIKMKDLFGSFRVLATESLFPIHDWHCKEYCKCAVKLFRVAY